MHSNLARRVVKENVVRQLVKGHDGSQNAGLRDKRETHIVNQLATHVPDIVLSSSHDRPLPYSQKFEGILMFADISGFTALCERYSMDSRNGRGTDRLSKALNDYLGLIVENIIASEGDVLKFAGDAFLALWKIKRDTLDFSIRRVIKCATRIQERCDNWNTEVGVKLRVKLGLSVGPMRITTVGNQECCHFVLSGSAVDDANQAEKFATSGSIILSPKIWAYTPDQELITHEVMADSKHIEVVEYLSEPPPEDIMSQVPENTKQAWDDLLEPSKKRGKRRPVSPWRKLSTKPDADTSRRVIPSADNLYTDVNEAESISVEDAKGRKRKTAFASMTDDEKSRLRKYIIRPVLQKIDDGLPLEYLSEMRQVSVLFINLIFVKGDDFDDMESLQTAFLIIYKGLGKYEGCLNKIFMFDKGCTFLCMFGVPGYKHEDDCARALKCSYQISERLKSAPNVAQASIGVTTGSSFCGVVGHVNRHEYTVIGKKVNMAARLMMHYPNRVSCDPETFHHSKLPRHFFRELPHREMKGVRQTGTIHEYTEDEGAPGQLVRTRSLVPYNEHTFVQEFEHPLLGRDHEMDLFVQEMQRVIKHRSKRGTQRHVIVVQGEAGIGKSRFLDASMAVADQLGMRTIALALSVNEATVPYYAVRLLMTLLLQMETCYGHLEREHVLLSHVTEASLKEKLCLLNDLLILKFPPCPKLQHMNSEELADELHYLLVKLVHKFAKEQCIVFVVDDAHYIDQYSWEFLNYLVEDSSTVCLLAIRPPSGDIAPPCNAAKKLISSRSTMHIKLRPMDGDHIAGLACQMLDVIRVPEDLISVLQEKCHGIPSWCEQILQDMLQTNAIELVPENSPQSLLSEANLVTPSLEVIQKRRDSIGSNKTRRASLLTQSMLFKIAEMSQMLSDESTSEREKESTVENEEVLEDKEDVRMVCVLAPGVILEELSIPDSMKGTILSRIDHLKPSEQLLVKCAAVLGMSFTREMLQAVSPSSVQKDGLKFRRAIHVLIQVGIFECDSPQAAADMKRFSGGLSSHFAHAHGANKLHVRTECHCPNVDKIEEESNEEEDSQMDVAISNCRNLRFTSTLLQETATDLLLTDQKKKLHRSAAEYLELHAHKCSACGSGRFIPSHGEQMEDQTDVTLKHTSKPSLFKQTARARSAKMPMNPHPERKDTIKIQVEDEAGPVQQETIPVELPKKKPGVKFDVESDASSSTMSGSSFIIRMRDKLHKRRPTSATLLKSAPTNEELENDSDVDDATENIESSGLQPGTVTSTRNSFINFRRSSSESTMSIISFEDSENSDDFQGLNFDKLDFRECRCLEVLNTIFPQLVRHWRAAGDTSKTIHFLVEAGGAAIGIGNNMQALTFLKEASNIIEEIDAGNQPLPDETNEHITVEAEDRGKISSMIGQSYFQMGQMEESLPYFLEALHILMNKQPTSIPGVYLKTMEEATKQLWHRAFPRHDIGRKVHRKSVRLLEQSRCLSHVWHLHNSQNWSLGALSAALQQVNRAEEASSDLEELINAYVNMMECCQVYGWHSLSQRYEKLAMLRCSKSRNDINFDNLVTVDRLYCVSMKTRLGRGKIERAIDSGYSAFKIAEKLHDNSLELEVLPILAFALMLAGRFSPCEEVLEKLKYAATEEEDPVAMCWYFYNCLDLFFEAGFVLETFQRCLSFYQKSGTDPVFITDNTSQFCLVVSFALWFCRHEDWNSAERWLLAAENIQPEHRNSMRYVQASLKLAECYLLGYCRVLSPQRIHSRASNEAKRNTKKYLNTVRSEVKRFPLLQPRFELLSLYFDVLSTGASGPRRLPQKLLRICAQCESYGNKQDYDWAKQCERVWVYNEVPKRKSSIEKSEQLFLQDTTQLRNSKGSEVSKFPLPLPALK